MWERDPTLIEDVLIATPNIPVSTQRPVIENVMGYPLQSAPTAILLLWDHSGNFNLDDPFWARYG